MSSWRSSPPSRDFKNLRVLPNLDRPLGAVSDAVFCAVSDSGFVVATAALGVAVGALLRSQNPTAAAAQNRSMMHMLSNPPPLAEAATAAMMEASASRVNVMARSPRSMSMRGFAKYFAPTVSYTHLTLPTNREV